MSEETTAQDNTVAATAQTTTTTATTTDTTQQQTQTTGQETTTTTAQTSGQQQQQQTTTDHLADYKPTLPEGMQVDQAAYDQFKPIAQEIGLKPEQADKLLGLYAQNVQGLVTRVVDDINSQCQENYDAVIAEVKLDPVLGGINFDGNMRSIDSMLTKYGDDTTPELFRAALTALSGFDKEAVRPLFNAVAKMAKDAAPDVTHIGKPKSQESDPYPGTPKGAKFR